MSSLWTPSGEHPVPRTTGEGPGPGAPQGGAGPGAPGGRDGAGGEQGGGRGGARDPRSRSGRGELHREPTPEEIEQAQAEMDAVREELLNAPVELVISNHAMGLWELAALHLSQKPPQLPQAQLAIDGMTALVEGLRGKLGDSEKTLADGLAQIRMAFVQIANAERARQGAGGRT